jgi:protein PhnA
MNTEQMLHQRSQSKCELCGAASELQVYEIPPVTTADAEHAVLTCNVCYPQVSNNTTLDPNHWHCLNDSMWTPVPAVQVMAWRILKRLDTESWAQDLLDMLYLDEETLTWAQAVSPVETEVEQTPVSKDSNGAALLAGDTVTLIKDLDVKGAGFTAKRGTVVKNISLSDNPDHIEGRVNGTRIVLLTKFLKKAT